MYVHLLSDWYEILDTTYMHHTQHDSIKKKRLWNGWSRYNKATEWFQENGEWSVTFDIYGF